jgi:hypothetical protein
VSSLAQTKLAPQYQAKGIDNLWISEGIPIPGDSILILRSGERYNVYIQMSAADTAVDTAAADHVNIRVISLASGQQIPAIRRTTQTFWRDGRVLLTKASFSVPASGSYIVRVATTPRGPVNALVKIGPSAVLDDQALITVSRIFAAAAGALFIVFVIVTIVLFRRYHRRRVQFKASQPG